MSEAAYLLTLHIYSLHPKAHEVLKQIKIPKRDGINQETCQKGELCVRRQGWKREMAQSKFSNS